MNRFLTRGMRTSEFWGMVVGWVATLIAYILSNDGTIYGYAAQVVKNHAPTFMVLLPSLYMVARVALKMVESWADAHSWVVGSPADFGAMPSSAFPDDMATQGSVAQVAADPAPAAKAS